MPLFYRGAGVETWYYQHDARISGFNAQNPASPQTINSLMRHILRGTINSPYVSLTRSEAVAWTYAKDWSRRTPTVADPAFVYVIELEDPLPGSLQLVDPVKAVALHIGEPTDHNTYHHDGPPEFLLGVVDPVANWHHATNAGFHYNYGNPMVSRSPYLSSELDTIVRALRDAEILALGHIPAMYVRDRYPVT